MPLADIVLMLMALLATGIVIAGLFHKLPVPYTVLLVLIGIGLNYASQSSASLEALQHFQLTPELVLFVFLPALIFESGLNLNSRQLIKDIGPVLTLAVPALLISTLIIGSSLWWLLSIPLEIALLFGALISATDPVAVISLFKELGTPERLTVLVEGESLLNDATAIVMVTILLGIVASGGFGLDAAVSAAGKFIVIFVGGALIGLLFGVVASWILNRIHFETSAVLVLSLVLGYLSFVIPEHILHVSGVMAVVGAAVMFGVFAVPNLSSEANAALSEVWEFVAQICNTLLFLLIGLSINPSLIAEEYLSILLAFALVLVSRASVVYSLVPLTTRLFKLPEITIGERHIMWWGGLKGGLAIAIVLSLPQDLPERQLLLTLTLGVVLLSLMINAPTIRPLISKLGLDQLSDDERADVKRSALSLTCHASQTLEEFRQGGLLSQKSYDEAQSTTVSSFQSWIPDVVADNEFRALRLQSIRKEQQELDVLFKSGVVGQYTYIDLRGELQRKRDSIIDQDRSDLKSNANSNRLLQLEMVLVHWLREKDWAARLMSSYQNMRLSKHVVRNIARILMAQSAVNWLVSEKGIKDEHRIQLKQLYKSELQVFNTQLNDVREDMPAFFERFELRMAMSLALTVALHEINEEHHEGSMPAKVYGYLKDRIHNAMDDLPDLGQPLAGLTEIELVRKVPLFNGLADDVLNSIVAKASTVRYLPGDSVIGAGERGDALYIMIRGMVEVYMSNNGQQEKVAELGAGEFFGEMALLGDQVRMADITAVQSCNLLRITRRDITELSEEHPEITLRLEKMAMDRNN